MMTVATLCPSATETDEVLLRQFATAGDQDALAELIARYGPVVYAAARRQIPDPSLAEDVAQCVFVTFARRAAKISSGGVLSAWLLQTTRFTAANAMKTALRRRLHEQAAASLPRPVPDDPADLAAAADEERHWTIIRPILDNAIARLGRTEQSAVVLRFFRGLTLRQVAAELGTTEEAARKRVSRALIRLRKHLTKSGPELFAANDLALAAMLSRRGADAPPAYFIAHATAAASSTIPTPATIGGLSMPLLVKLAMSIVSAILISAGGIKLIASADAPVPTAPDAQTPAAAAPDNPDWHTRLNAVYALPEGEFVKKVPPAFIPERDQFFAEINPQAAQASPDNKPNQFIIQQQPSGKFRLLSYGQISTSDGGGLPATAVFERLTPLQPNQIAGDDLLLQTAFRGDWVVRSNASTEQIIRVIAKAIGEHRQKTIQVTRSFINQDVIVARGQLRVPKDPNGDSTLHITLSPDADAHSGGMAPLSRILRTLREITGL